jgi:DNA-binding IscR family transcriptional regulator
MRRVRDAMAHILDSTTLADVIHETDQAKEAEARDSAATFQI